MRMYSPRRNSASRDMFPEEWCDEKRVKKFSRPSRWVKKSKVDERSTFGKWCWHRGRQYERMNFGLGEKCFKTEQLCICLWDWEGWGVRIMSVEEGRKEWKNERIKVWGESESERREGKVELESEIKYCASVRVFMSERVKTKEKRKKRNRMDRAVVALFICHQWAGMSGRVHMWPALIEIEQLNWTQLNRPLCIQSIQIHSFIHIHSFVFFIFIPFLILCSCLSLVCVSLCVFVSHFFSFFNSIKYSSFFSSLYTYTNKTIPFSFFVHHRQGPYLI